MSVGERIDTIVVTSPNQSEGKTTVTANLAIAFGGECRTHHRGLDGSQAASAPRSISTSPQPGLTNVLLGEASLPECCDSSASRHGRGSERAGSAEPNCSCSSATKVFDAIDKAAEIVIFDSPPVLPVSDALRAGQPLRRDGRRSVSFGRTRRHELTATLESLATINANVIGCVLTGTPSGGHYGYTYEYKPETSKSRRRPAAPDASLHEVAVSGGVDRSRHRPPDLVPPGEPRPTAPPHRHVDRLAVPRAHGTTAGHGPPAPRPPGSLPPPRSDRVRSPLLRPRRPRRDRPHALVPEAGGDVSRRRGEHRHLPVLAASTAGVDCVPSSRPTSPRRDWPEHRARRPHRPRDRRAGGGRPRQAWSP